MRGTIPLKTAHNSTIEPPQVHHWATTIALMSHRNWYQWATTFCTNEPSHLVPLSHYISVQWAITLCTVESLHLLPISRHISYKWATPSPTNELTHLLQMSCTDKNIVFRCDSDKNSLVIISYTLKVHFLKYVDVIILFLFYTVHVDQVWLSNVPICPAPLSQWPF